MKVSTKKATAFRLDDEDRAIIKRLKKRMGVNSSAQIVRIAIRVLEADHQASKPRSKKRGRS